MDTLAIQTKENCSIVFPHLLLGRKCMNRHYANRINCEKSLSNIASTSLYMPDGIGTRMERETIGKQKVIFDIR
jgi:hypothetical protein